MIDFYCSILTGLVCVQDYESEDKFSISDDRISHMLPTSYQDMIVRVYSKKPELVCKLKKLSHFDHNVFFTFIMFAVTFYPKLQVGAISEAFENFQLRTYGIKAQVHATPEKKMRCL